MAKVGITGITGYTGSQVCKYFLDKGTHLVRGSVRSSSTKYMEPLKEAFGDKYNKWEFFEADLTNKESIYEFVKGCDYVIHIASPFPDSNVSVSEEEIMRPAVNGTLDVLHAAKEFGIKRVVCTSSTHTIADFSKNKVVYTEEDFPSPENAINIYGKSKIVAELESWKFINQQTDGKKLELVTLHPGVILGPTLLRGKSFTSMDRIVKIYKGEFPSLPKVTAPYTDVRDLAEMHYAALNCPPNERFIVCNDSYFAHELGQWIAEDFKDSGYKPSTKVMSYWLAYLGSFKYPALTSSLKVWNKKYECDSSKARDILNYNPISVRESLKDMIESAIQQGYISSKL